MERDATRRWAIAGGGLGAVVVSLGLLRWLAAADLFEDDEVDGDATIELDDGTRATLISPESILWVSRETPREVVMQLDAGAARFEVRPDPSRRFKVELGEVAVQVPGAIFELDRRGGPLRVSVAWGRLRVEGRGPALELRAGESRTFAPP